MISRRQFLRYLAGGGGLSLLGMFIEHPVLSHMLFSSRLMGDDSRFMDWHEENEYLKINRPDGYPAWNEEWIVVTKFDNPNSGGDEYWQGMRKDRPVANRTLSQNGNIPGAVGSGALKHRVLNGVNQWFDIGTVPTRLWRIDSPNDFTIAVKAHLNAVNMSILEFLRVAGDAQIFITGNAGGNLQVTVDDNIQAPNTQTTSGTMSAGTPYIFLISNQNSVTRAGFHTSIPKRWGDIISESRVQFPNVYDSFRSPSDCRKVGGSDTGGASLNGGLYWMVMARKGLING